MLERGAPEHRADVMLGMFRGRRRGEFATTSPVLGEVLGRPTTPLLTTLRGVAGEG